jgi:hypothetical protein
MKECRSGPHRHGPRSSLCIFNLYLSTISTILLQDTGACYKVQENMSTLQLAGFVVTIIVVQMTFFRLFLMIIISRNDDRA